MPNLSGLYAVATDDNVTAEDHNSLVTAAQNIAAELPKTGSPTVTYDRMGNPKTVSYGGVTVTVTEGAAGPSSITNGTATWSISRDRANRVTGITEA